MQQKDEIRRRIAHFGAIAFNYSVFGSSLIVVALLASIFVFLLALLGLLATLLYYLLLIFAAIFTAGILILAEQYRAQWVEGTNFMKKIGDLGYYMTEEVAPVLEKVLPVAIYIILGLSIISFICMMFDYKWEQAKNRLVFMGCVIIVLVFLAVALAIGLITIANGGAK